LSWRLYLPSGNYMTTSFDINGLSYKTFYGRN
jgi:hypothetical protein